jgi:hypothetical protein
VTNAPLEASDPERAAVVRRKVLKRLTDVLRHYRALEADAYVRRRLWAR